MNCRSTDCRNTDYRSTNYRHAVRRWPASFAAVVVVGSCLGFPIVASPPPADEASPSAADAGREQFTRVRHAESKSRAAASHRLFNARSCAECHRQGGLGGGGPNENNVRLLNKLFIRDRLDLQAQFAPGGGVAVVHHRSNAPGYAEWRQALIEQLAPHDAEVALQAKYRLQNFAYVAAPGGSLFSIVVSLPPEFEQRNTPPLFGLGLIESIPQSLIDAVAANQPNNLRGRSPRLKGGGHGRFGWKSSTATLAVFNENACAVELGLSTPKFTPAQFHAVRFRANRTAKNSSLSAPSGTPRPADAVVLNTVAPDMSEADLSALNRFVANLPVPRQVVDQSRRAIIEAGAKHFSDIGCAACHRPNLGGVTGLYSDLLLHSVGTSGGAFYGGPSSDGGKPDFDFVDGSEFRTPPLWGVADSGPYLHDGSAATLDEAIVRHSDQALQSRAAYQKQLHPHQRHALLLFLESLRAPQP
jgi:CxxC motif-containing protein (DUF1111 family)